MKKILISMVLVVALSVSFVFADEVASQISVYFNNINVKVNGKKVSAPNILYEGRTYIQLREVAEILGKDVVWDDSTKTANINEKTLKVEEQFTFTKVKIVPGSYTKILGEVTNNDKVEKSIMGKVVFYAEDGEILGTATVVLNDLKAAETKTFETLTFDKVENYKTYKIQIDSVH